MENDQTAYERGKQEGKETGAILAALSSIDKKLDGVIANQTALEVRVRSLETDRDEAKGAWKAVAAISALVGAAAGLCATLAVKFLFK